MTGLCRTVSSVVAAGLVALLLSSCEQGEGDRCETQADCKSGLVCSQSLHVCQAATGGMNPDEVPPPDANAGPPDATDVDGATP